MKRLKGAQTRCGYARYYKVPMIMLSLSKLKFGILNYVIQIYYILMYTKFQENRTL